jgi:DNA-binding transcriptional MerR regulator
MVDLPAVSTAKAPAGSEALYCLDDLLGIASDQSGEEISSRTVRLYATEGLIDRPGKDRRRAVYGRRHLLQLLLIRALARRGLSLSAIAPLSAGSNEDLEQQLLQLKDCAHNPHLDQVRPAEREEALAYLSSLQGSPASASEGSSSLLPLLGSTLSSRFPSSSPTSRRSPSNRSSGRSNSASSRWHRFSLAPGVELHLSESASIPPSGSRREAWMLRLLDRLREQLDQEG